MSTISPGTAHAVRLVDLAHCRAGDKGDHSILMMRSYRTEDYAPLAEAVTAERVATHFAVPAASIEIFHTPHLQAITVVVRHRLAGGVTRSPRVDPHGKTLSGHLLEMEVPWTTADGEL